MKPKPTHLTEPYASQWEAAAMADAYPNRPPYDAGVFDILARLAREGAERESGRVLDVGCGTGDIARPLAARVDGVDALDRSDAMIALGRTLPGGNAPRWIRGRIEDVDDAELDAPYALVTAGECIHWFDWERAFPRLWSWAPKIALVFRNHASTDWFDAFREIIPRYSTNVKFEPYDLMDELSSRGLFHAEGEESTEPADFEQTAEQFIESVHSRNGFSRARMEPDVAAAFDAEVRELLRRHAPDGIVRLETTSTVKWGGRPPADR